MALEIAVLNNLPHNLPTGTYGAKEMQLLLIFAKHGSPVAEKRLLVSNEQQPLAAGETKKILIPLLAADFLSDSLRLDLERHSESHAERPPVILYSTTVAPFSEALH